MSTVQFVIVSFATACIFLLICDITLANKGDENGEEDTEEKE